MSTAVKTPKAREPKNPAQTPVAAPPAPEPAVPVYAPDRRALLFWLACAGLLILLHVLDLFR
jgi:hypothetical protein